MQPEKHRPEILMRTKYFLTIIGIIILIIGVTYLISDRNTLEENPNYQPITYFDPNRNAQQDLVHAIEEAKRSDRNILLDIGGDWCVWCKKLDAFFEENSDINNFMNQNYVILKINYSKENKNEEFLSQFPPIGGYPHLFVLDTQGKLLHSQNTGELESGDQHDREKVYAFLKAWVPGE